MCNETFLRVCSYVCGCNVQTCVWKLCRIWINLCSEAQRAFAKIMLPEWRVWQRMSLSWSEWEIMLIKIKKLSLNQFVTAWISLCDTSIWDYGLQFHSHLMTAMRQLSKSIHYWRQVESFLVNYHWYKSIVHPEYLFDKKNRKKSPFSPIQ